MRVPGWLTLGIAALVLAFGCYRIYLGLRRTPLGEDDPKPKRGLYAMKRNTHLFIGMIYLLLSGGLVAAAFGWNPLGSSIGPDTETPTKDTAPSKPGSIQIDQLPKPPAKK
jgi:hypothetical protein